MEDDEQSAHVGAPARDAGSFRDPTSAVYQTANGIVRGLDADTEADLRPLLAKGFLPKAIDRGDVVATEWCDDPGVEAGPRATPWAAWLRHEAVPTITYPYEWSFSMLREAALLQLRLLDEALAEDAVLKDATPYNIQFVGSRPVFIDLGSFERYRKGDPWFGYRQFCQLFLFPLMFQAYKDVPFQPWLRGSLEGITPAEARQVLRGHKRGRKGVLTHVELHARADDRYASTDDDVTATLKEAGFDKRLIVANVKKLSSIVESLQWHDASSEWSDYSDRGHYTGSDLSLKADFVTTTVSELPPGTVWDIGANDGYFSQIAARHAHRVLALDLDRLVVDRHYTSLRQRHDEQILPLVHNLADPSPGLGWRGAERPPLAERSRPDLALLLAVVHHLTITHHVPLTEVLEFTRTLAPRAIIEFPTEDDSMVRRLLKSKRAGLHDDYTLATFEKLLPETHEVLRREELPGGTRVMFDLRSR